MHVRIICVNAEITPKVVTYVLGLVVLGLVHRILRQRVAAIVDEYLGFCLETSSSSIQYCEIPTYDTVKYHSPQHYVLLNKSERSKPPV